MYFHYMQPERVGRCGRDVEQLEGAARDPGVAVSMRLGCPTKKFGKSDSPTALSPRLHER
jgi:hypothetical protein